MVTLIVAAILVTIGVPSFNNIVRNNRAATDANDLVTALALARSTATQRGREILVCASDDGADCSATKDWSAGWIVREAPPGAEVLRVWPARRAAADVLIADTDRVRFDARGGVINAPIAFQLRLPDCKGNEGRDILVNVAGRHSVQRAECP